MIQYGCNCCGHGRGVSTLTETEREEKEESERKERKEKKERKERKEKKERAGFIVELEMGLARCLPGGSGSFF